MHVFALTLVKSTRTDHLQNLPSNLKSKQLLYKLSSAPLSLELEKLFELAKPLVHGINMGNLNPF